ncbi:hypothetical protein HUT16_17280 [Kitasatospora sp. NA04385]|uniref:hypothetical protein n=1 Tax=Kitasatospora sp. NA04385 TaxID=2742135 RepID=UPI0015908782|nr:hypothetical protein [Kitasatospora sp. NA04385]QKW20589.1 hypothetical protein HUT16_17280 [Kitasatospora sp. NA04385]
MQVHRSAHARGFIVLPNTLTQDRRLSFTARGLLADLLSRPDGWSEDAQQIADSSVQGRSAIRAAFKELREAGYYLVVKVRMPDGTIRSEAHVFDVPHRPGAEIIRQAVQEEAERQARPAAPRPASGEPASGVREALPVKNGEKAPSPLPPKAADGSTSAEQRSAVRSAGGRTKSDDQKVEPPDERTRAAALALHRALRPEPRLRLGEAEALALAPLAARWLARGFGAAELAQALLPGLPERIHSPRAVVRSRLVDKLPPVCAPEQPQAPQKHECANCGDPVPRSGLCGPCQGRPKPAVKVGGGQASTPAGAARARAGLRPTGGRVVSVG